MIHSEPTGHYCNNKVTSKMFLRECVLLFHVIVPIVGVSFLTDKYHKETKDVSGATITRIETRDKFVCYSKCSVNPVCQGVMYNQHTRQCEMAQSIRLCNPGLQEIWMKQGYKTLSLKNLIEHRLSI